IDLFVGSEGTLGIIAEATLRVKRRPLRCVALVSCESEEQAVNVSAGLRAEAESVDDPLEIAAIEYIDAKSLRLLDDATFAHAGLARPAASATLLLVQIEMEEGLDAALARFDEILHASGVEID